MRMAVIVTMIMRVARRMSVPVPTRAGLSTSLRRGGCVGVVVQADGGDGHAQTPDAELILYIDVVRPAERYTVSNR